MRAKQTIAAAFTAAALLSTPALARDVIHIIADDIPAYPSTGSFGWPGFNAIANQGRRYPNAYGAPLCTPARVEALTGRIGDDFGISGNRPVLPASTQNLGRILTQAGVETHFVGKGHIGPRNFLDFGFNFFYGTHSGYVDYFGNTASIPTYDQRTRFYNQGYITDTYVNRVVRDLGTASGSNRYFYVALNNAHDPIQTNAAQLALVPADVRGSARNRAATTIQFDRALQRILAVATPDDMIIVTGDNGFVNSRLRGRKGGLYEGGLRIPFTIRAPGRLPAGGVENAPVRLADVLPTVLDFLGLPIPGGLDGRSILQGVQPNRPLAFVSPGRGNGDALVVGRLKYLRGVDGIANQLYDLNADPREANNIAAGNPGTVATMRAQLQAQLGR